MERDIYATLSENKRRVHLHCDGKEILALNPEEANSLLNDLEALKEDNRMIFEDFKTIPFQELEEFCENRGFDVSEIIRIEFDLERSTSFAPEVWRHFYITIQGERFYSDDISPSNDTAAKVLKNNFSKEQIWFGTITNHELRASLDQDFLEFLQNNPQIDIRFCDKRIRHEVFFNENKNFFFEAIENSDT